MSRVYDARYGATESGFAAAADTVAALAVSVTPAENAFVVTDVPITVYGRPAWTYDTEDVSFILLAADTTHRWSAGWDDDEGDACRSEGRTAGDAMRRAFGSYPDLTVAAAARAALQARKVEYTWWGSATPERVERDHAVALHDGLFRAERLLRHAVQEHADGESVDRLKADVDRSYRALLIGDRHEQVPGQFVDREHDAADVEQRHRCDACPVDAGRLADAARAVTGLRGIHDLDRRAVALADPGRTDEKGRHHATHC